MSRHILERSMPHDIDAEKAVLGNCLLNHDQLIRTCGVLSIEDFYMDCHRHLFRAMSGMVTEQRPVDLITLQDELIMTSKLENSGGMAYISDLLTGVPNLLNIGSYIGIIKEKSALRRMINLSNRVMCEAFDMDEPSTSIVERAIASLMELTRGTSDAGFLSLEQMRQRTAELVERLYRERQLVTGVASGFTNLDRLTSGFQPGDLIVIAARPSVGKTALALNIAQHAAFRANVHVGMFSMEMSKEQLNIRLICAEAMVDASKMRTGYMNREEFTNIIETLDATAQRPLYIDDSSKMTLIDMRSKCLRLQTEHGLGLVIVDYIQLMSGYGKQENRTQEISSISRGLKALAKELRVPVIALSQVSRASEQRGGDHRPMLSDLRDSGSIEQDADTVIFIFREEMYKPDDDEFAGRAELIVAKQRNGPTGVVRLAFLKHFTKFENLLEI